MTPPKNHGPARGRSLLPRRWPAGAKGKWGTPQASLIMEAFPDDPLFLSFAETAENLTGVAVDEAWGMPDLRAFREMCSLSFGEVLRATGFDPLSLEILEQGWIGGMGVGVLVEIARALHVPIAAFFRDEHGREHPLTRLHGRAEAAREARNG